MTTLSADDRKNVPHAAATPEPTRLRPVTLEPADVAAGNALLRVTPIRLELSGAEYVVEAGVAGGESGLESGDYWALTMTLSAGAREARLDISRHLLSLAESTLECTVSITEMAQQLRIAVIAAACDSRLTEVEQRLGVPLTVSDVQPYKRIARDDAPMVRLRDGSDGEYLGGLRLLGTAVQWVAGALGDTPSIRRQPELARAALHVGVPPVRLTANEIRSLRQGDVVLVGQDIAYEVSLARRTLGIARSEDARTFTIERLGMTENSQDSTGADSASWESAGDVTVPVAFDVGHAWATLDELAALQPGYVFAIEGGDATRVRVHAGGRTLGYGELVQVGDRLGVRLLEIGDGADGVDP